MRKSALVLFAVVLLAGCSTLTAPKGVNGTAAYAGSTLQAVEQTAAAQYPTMPKSRAKAIHGYIQQAEQYRDQALTAIQSGNTNTAQTNLQKLAAIMSTINAALQKAANGGH